MSQRFSVKQFGAVVKALDESRAKVADREKRIRLAKKMLRIVFGPVVTGTTAWRLLDLRWKLGRKPLSRRTKRKTP